MNHFVVKNCTICSEFNCSSIMSSSTKRNAGFNFKNTNSTSKGKKKRSHFSVFCPTMDSELICDSYSDFVFEVNVCNKKNDVERYKKLVKFGEDVSPIGDVKVAGLRANFSHDHFIQRISLYLLDCTAHLTDNVLIQLKNDFQELFPIVKASTIAGNRIRVISTGSLFVIVRALLRVNFNKSNVCLTQLKPHTSFKAQYDYRDKYVLLASCFIEIFYLGNVRVLKSNNPDLNYGLFLNSEPNYNRDVVLCCGVNFATHSHTTTASLDTSKTAQNLKPDYGTDDEKKPLPDVVSLTRKRRKTVESLSEYVNGLTGGFFGVSYYINSVTVHDSPTVEVEEEKDVIVNLYQSGVNGKSGRFLDDHFTVDMTFVKLRPKNSKGRIVHVKGDELLWKYHAYL